MRKSLSLLQGLLTNQKVPLNTNSLIGNPFCGNPKATLAAFDQDLSCNPNEPAGCIVLLCICYVTASGA